MSDGIYEVAVIGGGVNGLAAAAALVARGCERLVVLERFEEGHDRGSSHGAARITRSVYAHADYVRLMQRVHAESWPALEARAKRTLVHRNPGCFFGPEDGLFGGYAAAVDEALEGGLERGAGGVITRLSRAEGARRFPMFRFAPGEGVLDDHTSGLVAAADTMDALRGICREAGVELRYGARARAVHPGSEPLTVELDGGEVRAEKVIVAAGAWAGALIPSLASRLTVTRQAVCYLGLENPEAGRLGRYPVWVELGRSDDDVWYGLPEFGREGIKAAHHRVVAAGEGDDPDEDYRPEPARVDRLVARMRARLTLPVTRLTATERCLYTVGPGEDFVIDLHPEDPRIVVAAGFAGHGFKFGPLTGRVLAELALDGVSSVPEFEAARERFRMG